MSIFNIEDKIDYNWLIDNGFKCYKRSELDEDHIFTKILRTRNPFVYININIITFETVLQWVDIGKGEGMTNTQALYMGVITDKIQMSSIMHKYSQENCLH